MSENNMSVKYQCGGYLRLSKEDGDISSARKQVSDSIENQKRYIEDYLASRPEIQMIQFYIDDGYSGTNFERPSFQKMLGDIREGRINCVIVKDLSRFGRNYIEAGKYIEQLFPLLKVRFIAINDHYDSTDDVAANYIIVPFKNLINDAYCRDLSLKIRSHLEIKRKQGEFVGAFTVYGYRKENKSKLVVDEYAAEIVKEIYQMKMNGMSQQVIADELNSLGILSPAEYKKDQGSGYRAGFQKYSQAKWSAVAVRRILTNEIYTGILIQGKESTANYKIRIREKKPQEQWCRVENSHDAIIKQADFETVQTIMKKDSRILDGKKEASIYSGYLRCADCGCSIVRKKTGSGLASYVYYVCSGNKKNKASCSGHRISEEALHEAVKKTLRLHVGYGTNLQESLRYLTKAPYLSRKVSIIDMQLEKAKEEAAKFEILKLECYEDYKSGLLSKDEYPFFRSELEKRVQETERIFLELQKRKDDLVSNQSKSLEWLKEFLEHADSDIRRSLIVRFIECIYVYEDRRIEVIFRYEDEIEKCRPWPEL